MKRIWQSRRLIVVGFYGSLAGMIVLLNRNLPQTIEGKLFMVCAAVFAVSLVRLAIVVKPYCVDGLRWVAPASVDERQSRVRDRALGYSYWVTSALVVSLTLWISAAQLWGWMWQPRGTGDWLMALWLITTVTSMLPAALIAWNEPPEPAPDAMQHREIIRGHAD